MFLTYIHVGNLKSTIIKKQNDRLINLQIFFYFNNNDDYNNSCYLVSVFLQSGETIIRWEEFHDSKVVWSDMEKVKVLVNLMNKNPCTIDLNILSYYKTD